MVLGVGTWDKAGCPVPASGVFLTWSSLPNQVFFALSLCLAFQCWNAQMSEGEGDSLTNIGLYCYALRQADMWRCMASQARHEFDKVRQNIEQNAHK